MEKFEKPLVMLSSGFFVIRNSR